jgi:hypothetical protein
MRVDDLDEAEETITIKSERVGYAKVTRRRHDHKPTGKLAHLWWYRCLARAAVVSEGTTSGINAPWSAYGGDWSCSAPTTIYA